MFKVVSKSSLISSNMATFIEITLNEHVHSHTLYDIKVIPEIRAFTKTVTISPHGESHNGSNNFFYTVIIILVQNHVHTT